MTQERGSARTIALEPSTCYPEQHKLAAAVFTGQESAEGIAVTLATRYRMDRKLVAHMSIELKVQHLAMLAPFHESQDLSGTEARMQHRV